MSEAVYYVARGSRERGSGIGSRLIKPLIILLALGIVVEALYSFVVAPSLRIERIELQVPAQIQREDVLTWAGVAENMPYLSVDVALARAKLEANPQVLKAEVSLYFPNCLSISVTPRTLVAVVLAETASGARAFAVDSEGVVMREATAEESQRAPLVSGLRFEGEPIGSKIPVELASVIATIGAIGARSPELTQEFSEFKLVSKRYGGFELLLYPVSTKILVKSNAELNEDQLRYMMLVLDVFKKQGMEDKVKDVDFRTGDVVYTTKGAES